MKPQEHEWIDHGRWRECARCGQKQYQAAAQPRGNQAFGNSVVSKWLPEPEPCVQQDSDDQLSRRRAILTASLRRKFRPKPKDD
jgi:hypothetical protein